MIVIIACSVTAIAICIERFFVLNQRRIAPPHLLATVWKQLKGGELDSAPCVNRLPAVAFSRRDWRIRTTAAT